eukprot:6005396-Pyramimonas_sp.AAC.1
MYWMNPRENRDRVWHFVFLNDYNYYFPRKEGKGYSNNKNNDKDKCNMPAPYVGRGKGGRSASPYWAADQTGGLSSSHPRPPSPPSGRFL